MREDEKKKKKIFSIHWFTHQRTTKRQGWASPEPRASTGSPMWVQGSRHLGHFLQLSQAHYLEAGSEEEQLGHKLASQATQPATPQLWSQTQTL